MIKRPLCFVCLVFLMIQGIILMIEGGLSDVKMPASSIFLKTEGQEVYVTGEVYNKKTTLNTQVLFLKNNSISNQEKIIIYDSNFTNVSIGQTIQIKGTIKHFERARNPGNFDQALYYAKDGIYGAVFCDEILQITGEPFGIREHLFQLKCAWKEMLIENMGEEQGNVLAAMLLGEKSGMDEDVKEAYQKSGIGHVLAISGLHISLIGFGIYQMLRKMKMPFGIAGLMAVIVLSLYVCMIGYTISVLRAFVMLIIKIGADVTGRVYDMLTALLLSAAITIGMQPLYFNDAGFYLSYGAVLGLLIFSPYLSRTIMGKRKVLQAFIPGICVNLMLLPIQLWYYYEFPMYSILLNLIVIPLMGGVLTLGMMGSVLGIILPPGGQMSLLICKWILVLYEEMSTIVLRLPYARIVSGRPEFHEVIVYYLLICLILLGIIKKKTVMIAGYLLSTWLLLYTPSQDLQITMMDVGQGDGIYIKGPNGNHYLIDGGSSDVKELGKYRIEPYLKFEGVRTIDYAFVSHGDGDHYSGIIEMLPRQEVGVKIRCLVLPANYKEDASLMQLAKVANVYGTEVVVMEEGEILREGELQIICIQPKHTSKLSGNAGSMVLEVAYGQFNMLCTGDVEEKGEKELITKIQGKQYDVLKVAHHGSKYSTEDKFLDAISVSFALISAGEHNSYGHPHQETLERLRKEKCKIYQTSLEGAIRIWTNGNSLTFF